MADNIPTELWEKIDQAVKAFEDAWQGGQRPQIEDYLRDAGPERAGLLVELIHVDLEQRQSAGHGSDRGLLAPRFSQTRAR